MGKTLSCVAGVKTKREAVPASLPSARSLCSAGRSPVRPAPAASFLASSPPWPGLSGGKKGQPAAPRCVAMCLRGSVTTCWDTLLNVHPPGHRCHPGASQIPWFMSLRLVNIHETLAYRFTKMSPKDSALNHLSICNDAVKAAHAPAPLPSEAWRGAAGCKPLQCSCHTLCAGHTVCTDTWGDKAQARP